MNAKNSLPEMIDEGRQEPMGSLARDGGVNFAVFSQHAARIELCLFDTSGTRELRRYALHGPRDGVFHGFLPGVGPGLVYGIRAHGHYAPESGHRFNPHKLLLDPWAREIVGHFGWRAEHHGYEVGHPEGPRSFDARDNAAHALKARVAAPSGIAPGTLNAPRHASAEVVLYEVHVKGFSMTHPDIPATMRGTYSALAHPASIAHFKALGVTTLSLLPVQYCVDEAALVDRGMRNYWGYNTLGFFCPDPRLAMSRDDPAAVTAEFRQMIDTLHMHGLEVVMDVVYNHTPEGNEFGPTLSFRGLDNASWYRLVGNDKSHSENLTGCGNTLNVEHPRVTQFVLDSLRYWVQEMGVDGFRFDLAPVLGRRHHGFDPYAAFFVALQQDPILARVHLIAEPWDAGYDGYQLGRFPGRFLEWNDKFRDSIRGYWLQTGVSRGELARRFTASNDLFHHGQRRPTASVNFVAVHDGFTLADVVSYSKKHNQANGEDNRDGRDNELCANFGAEGPVADAAILATRKRVQRAMAMTMLLAQGTPMLCAGDEIGNSQQGNNNAYCQDNATGWLDWTTADNTLQKFIAEVIALRRAESLLRHDRWFVAHNAAPGDATVTWYTPGGHEMQMHDWHDHGNHAFGCRITTAAAESVEPGDSLMICLNPEPHAIAFSLPPGRWQIALDSSGDLVRDAAIAPSRELSLPPRAVVILRALASTNSD
ncbi:MAG: glycogen debranching protein GlgX [Betaproteobacteria bacterium]|nr:glycogen debranching protein GlgX [Betaproteobacteria bacterium]